jgi:hypothetical protein
MLLGIELREQQIALGEMRESGPTRLIVFCDDYRCASVIIRNQH